MLFFVENYARNYFIFQLPSCRWIQRIYSMVALKFSNSVFSLDILLSQKVETYTRINWLFYNLNSFTELLFCWVGQGWDEAQLQRIYWLQKCCVWIIFCLNIRKSGWDLKFWKKFQQFSHCISLIFARFLLLWYSVVVTPPPHPGKLCDFFHKEYSTYVIT